MKAQLVQSYVFAEQKDIVKGEIMNHDVLLRIDRLVDQIMQTDAAFRQMREMQEEMYDF